MSAGRIIVVGAGLAGLRAACKAAESGLEVTLLCRLQGGRTASACAQGGINAALNNYGDGDSPWEHFCDTIRAGAFLADQKPVLKMCEAAPEIVDEMARCGALFSRTADGRIDQRYFGGSKKRRTCFVGSSTGQALVLACESMARGYEASGKITRREGYEFLSAVIDGDGRCRGVVAQHVASGEILGFLADAVIVASGGASMIYGKSTNPLLSNGSAAAGLYLQGAALANAEFVQFHPTAMPGNDKDRLVSECVRGEGGRVLTYRDGKPWYFLEEMFPEWGNLITRDKASQAIYYVCNELGLGSGAKNEVLLDISHLPKKLIDTKLRSVTELYDKYGGGDPRREPMRVFPSAHYFMGGLFTDDGGMTTIQGLFAAGECNHSYHGANRLGGNSLLSALYSGGEAGRSAAEYAKQLRSGAEDGAEKAEKALEDEIKRQRNEISSIMGMNGTENPYALARRFGAMLRENVFIVRFGEILEFSADVIQNYLKKWEKINVLDSGGNSNHTALYVRQLRHMMEYARVIAKSALLREESRGAHFRPDFPERDDATFLKTTIARYAGGKPEISFRDVDTSLVPPDTERRGPE